MAALNVAALIATLIDTLASQGFTLHWLTGHLRQFDARVRRRDVYLALLPYCATLPRTVFAANTVNRLLFVDGTFVQSNRQDLSSYLAMYDRYLLQLILALSFEQSRPLPGEQEQPEWLRNGLPPQVRLAQSLAESGFLLASEGGFLLNENWEWSSRFKLFEKAHAAWQAALLSLHIPVRLPLALTDLPAMTSLPRNPEPAIVPGPPLAPVVVTSTRAGQLSQTPANVEAPLRERGNERPHRTPAPVLAEPSALPPAPDAAPDSDANPALSKKVLKALLKNRPELLNRVDAIYLSAARQLESGFALVEHDDRSSLEKLISKASGQVEQLVTYVLDGRIAGVPPFIVITRRPSQTRAGPGKFPWKLIVNHLIDMSRLYPQTAAFIEVCLDKKKGYFFRKMRKTEKAGKPPAAVAVATPAAVRVISKEQVPPRLPAQAMPPGPPKAMVESLRYRADRIYLDLAKTLALSNDLILIRKSFDGLVHYLRSHHNEDAAFVEKVLRGQVEHVPQLFYRMAELSSTRNCVFHLDPLMLRFFPATRTFISDHRRATGNEAWARPAQSKAENPPELIPPNRPAVGLDAPRKKGPPTPPPLKVLPVSGDDSIARYMQQVAGIFTDGKQA